MALSSVNTGDNLIASYDTQTALSPGIELEKEKSLIAELETEGAEGVMDDGAVEV